MCPNLCFYFTELYLFIRLLLEPSLYFSLLVWPSITKKMALLGQIRTIASLFDDKYILKYRYKLN